MGPHILNSPNKPKKNRTSKGHSKDMTGSSAQISHPIRDIWKHQGAKGKKERVQSGVELPQLSWDPDTGWILKVALSDSQQFLFEKHPEILRRNRGCGKLMLKCLVIQPYSKHLTQNFAYCNLKAQTLGIFVFWGKKQEAQLNFQTTTTSQQKFLLQFDLILGFKLLMAEIMHHVMSKTGSLICRQ